MHPAFGNKIVIEGHGDTACSPTLNEHPTDWAYYHLMPVGHNLKFDFGFTYYRENELCNLIAQDVPVWDTQVAEYVNGGGLLSLEAACAKHGVDFTKDDEVKRYWSEGYDTEDIPQDILNHYLREDLRATRELFDKQYELYTNKQLIIDMSKVAAALAFIEQEGMYVDEETLLKYAEKLVAEEQELWAKVTASLKRRGWPDQVEFKPNSAAHLDLLFFGGAVSFKERQCVGKYKNGKDKYKQVEVGVDIQPPKMAGELTKPTQTPTGKPSFDDGWFARNTGLIEEVDTVHRIRAIRKEMSTFVEGVVQSMSPDGLLHGDFNNCVTATGRLSSSNPNLQNLTNQSEFKKVFTSRYGEDGYIMEVDYSQLEIVVLACLSKDKQLLEDMRAGRDLHYETGKTVFGWTDPSEMDKDDRRTVKGVNFGLVYGGGAKTISQQTGAPVVTVQRLIDAFYARYPGVKVWQEETKRMVEARSEWGSSRTTSGVPAMDSQLVSPCGRVWKFTQDDPPWGGDPNFSPTKMKNYPVQGFATGDIVPLAVQAVARWICAGRRIGTHCYDRVHLTCTVHDSILLDVDRREFPPGHIAKVVQILMTKTVEEKLLKDYNVELPVDLEVEASYGPNWHEQEKLKL